MIWNSFVIGCSIAMLMYFVHGVLALAGARK